MSDLKLTAEETAIWDAMFAKEHEVVFANLARDAADQHILARRARLAPPAATVAATTAPAPVKCQKCNGDGEVDRPVTGGPMHCPECGGNGFIVPEPTPTPAARTIGGAGDASRKPAEPTLLEAAKDVARHRHPLYGIPGGCYGIYKDTLFALDEAIARAEASAGVDWQARAETAERWANELNAQRDAATADRDRLAAEVARLQAAPAATVRRALELARATAIPGGTLEARCAKALAALDGAASGDSEAWRFVKAMAETDIDWVSACTKHAVPFCGGGWATDTARALLAARAGKEGGK